MARTRKRKGGGQPAPLRHDAFGATEAELERQREAAKAVRAADLPPQDMPAAPALAPTGGTR